MRLSELTDGLYRGILSLIQVHIFHNRCANPADRTYARIQETYSIKRDKAIWHALLRTFCGLFLDSGMGGGRDPHLSPLDRPTFRDHILARATELNCITRRDALILDFDLALQRRRIAVIRLETGCLEPAGMFDGIVRRTNGGSAELLTDFDSIQRLFAEQNCRIITDQDLS
jgi:hypothetical protein